MRIQRVLASVAVLACLAGAARSQDGPTTYVRYSHDGQTAYGILDDGQVYELFGDPFASPTRSGVTHELTDVTLLAPCEPSKIIAVGLNYRSHLGDRPVPDVGVELSARWNAVLRANLLPLGITQMSAGSCTVPRGPTTAGSSPPTATAPPARPPA